MALPSKKKRSRSDASGDGPPAAEEDSPFPRGGASLLTPLEERKIKVRAKADFEREIAASRGPDKKKKRKSADKEQDVEGGLFKIQSATGDVPKFIDLLKFTSLTVGGKIWGVVLEVNRKRLVVSLPLGLRGFVAPSDSSDVLAALSAANPNAHESELRAAIKGPAPTLESLFYPGQFVRCVVKSLDAPAETKKDEKAGKKKVHLSLKLSDVSSGIDKTSLHTGAVLPGVIRTVEEHGSVLSLGVDGVSAFLPSASYTAAFGAAVAPLPGQLLQVVVKQLLRGGSSVIVGCEAAEVAQAAISGDNAVTMNDLLPGHLVTVTVRHVLPDGLVVSFLKYFHGCIDRFHLPQDLLASWRTALTPGMRLKARILYISPADKLVRLTLLKNLISYHLPSDFPPLGTLLEPVRVFRADPAVGVLCSLPAAYASMYGYVHISHLRDSTTVPSNVSKEFPPGTEMRAKVIGFRPMDALVTLTARSSVVESSDVTWDTLEAGMVLSGRVHAVRESGLTVQLTPEIRGLVPLAHVSDSAAPKKVSSKFKPGQSVRVRAIEVDSKRKRVMLSMNKGVLTAKTPALLSAAEAERGMRTHGWVTGVTPTAVFVGLYNKLKGIVPAKTISLPEDTTLQESYMVGQVVKCTVVGEDPEKGLRLSFSATLPVSGTPAAGASTLGGLAEGQIVCNATVTEVERFEDDEEHVRECTLALVAPSGETVVAKMDRLHFSDHMHGCEVMSAALRVGSVIPCVLVLERRPKSSHVVVSRKGALMKAAQAGLLPGSVGSVSPGQHVTGYVSSLTAKSCFVRFLGRCTARAGASQLGDEHVAAAPEAYKEGQTVMAVVLEVDSAKDQMTVSLKPSQTIRSDSSLLMSLFEDMKLAATIAGVDTSNVPRIGSVITVPAKEMRPYGLVCDIPSESNLAGLIATSNLPSGDVGPGDKTEAAVLDVHELDGIVDLSADNDVRKACKHSKGDKAMSALKAGDKVSAKVVLVKPDAAYCVVQLDCDKGVLGFVPTCDYNVQHSNAKKAFEHGDTLAATVISRPSPAIGGRLLLHTPLVDDKRPHKSGSTRAQKSPPGTIVNGTVAVVHAAHAEVIVDGVKGRLHASEVQEMDAHTSPIGTKPLTQLKAGQDVRAVVLPHTHHLLLSMRPSAIAAAEASASDELAKALTTPLSVGQEVAGAVDEAKADHLYVSLPNDVRVRVHCLHASSDPGELANLQKKFAVGTVVRGRLLEVDTDRKHVSLSLLPETFAPLCKGGPSPKVGQLVMAKVHSASGQGVWCWLANGAVATVALTELHDAFVPNALKGLQAGTFVRAAVAQLPAKGGKLKLTLRASQGGLHAGHAAASNGPETPQSGKESAFRSGQTVHGYVRSVKPAKSKGAGVFVSLSESVTGRMQLRNLADAYVEDPGKEFPEGKHITARILIAQDGRIELTRKTAKPDTRKPDLKDFSLGQELRGTVTRAEPFGVFVQLDDSSATGLVHVSELSGKFVKNVPAEYPVGRKVKVAVLSIDTEKGRLSLGMKAKYFTDAVQDDNADTGDAGADAPAADTGSKSMQVDVENALLAAYDESDEDDEADDSGQDKEDQTGLDSTDEDMADAEEAGRGDEDGASGEDGGHADESEAQESDDDQADQADPTADPYGWDALLKPAAEPVKEAEVEEATKLSKRAKKKARDEQEAAVRKAELAKLEDAPPESTEDFERLVLGSPNSSYLWIRYMAFLLGMAEVVKAREVAERALKTIDIREQGEKLNVWVAYLNLENSFADDPTQAAADLFKRAVQQNDAKKVHLAAVDIFQRSQRKELLEMCAKSMRRKFRESCKVWLRLVQLALDDKSQIGPLLEQATQALPKRKHVKFLSRVALLEFKEGSPERGRGVFENVLQTYPKRTDVWGMYIDQEIKLGNTVPVRNLFERAINLNLKPKRMRYFFKRYLAFEEAHGSPEKVEYVKKCAMEFIQGQTGNDR